MSWGVGSFHPPGRRGGKALGGGSRRLASRSAIQQHLCATSKRKNLHFLSAHDLQISLCGLKSVDPLKSATSWHGSKLAWRLQPLAVGVLHFRLKWCHGRTTLQAPQQAHLVDFWSLSISVSLLPGSARYKPDLESVESSRLYLRSVWLLPSCAPWASAIAPARRRGPGPRPATTFEYNLRRVPPSNSNPSLARDKWSLWNQVPNK